MTLEAQQTSTFKKDYILESGTLPIFLAIVEKSRLKMLCYSFLLKVNDGALLWQQSPMP